MKYSLLVLPALGGVAADWAEFRGPGGRAVSDDANLPDHWTATENVAYKILGYSGQSDWTVQDGSSEPAGGTADTLSVRVSGDAWNGDPAFKLMLNGVTELHLMKADVLDAFPEIQVCTHYRLPDGTRTSQLPDPGDLVHVTPELITLPGWHTDLTRLTDPQALPKNLLAYLTFLEQELLVPIRIVSVGPDRVSTLRR